MSSSIRYQNSSIFNQINENNQIIKYSCSCGKSFHLTEEYYCNGCQKINCKFCVTEEIDGYYCPNCLEHISIPEANLSGMRCKKCFECPTCFNILTYTSNSGSGNLTESTNESYFLNCSFCKWNTYGNNEFNQKLIATLTQSSPTPSSVNVQGTPLQSSHGMMSPTSMSNNSIIKVLETLNKESSELNSLKDKKAISRLKMAQAMKQFLVQDQKHHKSNQRKNYIKTEDRWISNSTARQQPNNKLIPNIVSNPLTHNNLLSIQNIKQTINSPISYQDSEEMQILRSESRVFPEIMDNQAFQDDEIPETLYSLQNTDEVPSLTQRFKHLSACSLNLNNIPTTTITSSNSNMESMSLLELQPQHRYLLTRRSKRCKRCDRLLMKPDIKPDKIEFKRQHFAFSLVPRVYIQRAIWTDIDMFELSLIVTNPLHSHMFIFFPTQSKTSFISVDDNSQPIDLLFNETFVNGLLDEIDDNEKESYIQQLKQKDNSRYIIERKDNKLYLRFFIKVIPSELNSILSSSSGSDDHVLQINESSIQPLQDLNNLKKFPSTYTNIKFTLLMEFSQKPNQLSSSNNSLSSSSSSNINLTSSTGIPNTGTTSTFSSSSTPINPTSTTNISTDNLQKNLLKILFDIPSNRFENTI